MTGLLSLPGPPACAVLDHHAVVIDGWPWNCTGEGWGANPPAGENPRVPFDSGFLVVPEYLRGGVGEEALAGAGEGAVPPVAAVRLAGLMVPMFPGEGPGRTACGWQRLSLQPCLSTTCPACSLNQVKACQGPHWATCPRAGPEPVASTPRGSRLVGSGASWLCG